VARADKARAAIAGWNSTSKRSIRIKLRISPDISHLSGDRTPACRTCASRVETSHLDTSSGVDSLSEQGVHTSVNAARRSACATSLPKTREKWALELRLKQGWGRRQEQIPFERGEMNSTLASPLLIAQTLKVKAGDLSQGFEN